MSTKLGNLIVTLTLVLSASVALTACDGGEACENDDTMGTSCRGAGADEEYCDGEFWVGGGCPNSGTYCIDSLCRLPLDDLDSRCDGCGGAMCSGDCSLCRVCVCQRYGC